MVPAAVLENLCISNAVECDKTEDAEYAEVLKHIPKKQ